MVCSDNFVLLWTLSNTSACITDTDQEVDEMDSEDEFISDYARLVIIFVNHVILDMCVCVFGIVGNCLNITVFLRQGLRTSVNLSLCAMSLSDLIGLIFQVWHNFCLNPFLVQLDLPVDFLEVQVLTGGCPNVVMTRITGWITMFITAERCLSVLTPLNVRRIVTFERSVVILLLCYSINLAFFLPRYAYDYLSFIVYPALNKTKLAIGVRDGEEVIVFFLNLSHFYLSIIAFVVVVMNTAILVVSLRRKSKWRKNVVSNKSQQDVLSSRENKTMALVIMVATVLIICYTPGVVCAFLEIFDPDFSFYAKQENVYHVTWSFCFLFNSINASINVLVYYRMSSKYRSTLLETFPMLKGKKAKI
uniref:G-protein coupled receptors family 1 profile domain-containing protein n=1 Tax=Biomphalaria glabrata TaxID=6526 RepID=A0A2C9KV02_BIOGL